METAPVIRPLTPADRADWQRLWGDYCAFYQASIADSATETLWSRLTAPDYPIHGLVASDANGLLGFCHYVCHPHTWSERTVGYLEDPYIAPAARRLGLGTVLIEALCDIGRRENWRRLYWITNADNDGARAVYDRLARRTGHLRYEIDF